ncbi:helix-turn-helix transcriptional regulator [Cytobacillus kochii]|uniref:helix-turn-helix transcriptional regulator n=1 Tax=Cytobacillus kochii TaxID=859143 RepID=UPI001CD61918|nr:helix-turn-helix transcriptional regulator [Cytobacillus kochii]MCA1029309.1 helix-turn-helix transcriptional regulator [Cytobacillus kochii]
MYFEDASRKQLLQICLDENCPVNYKYEAARELQMRQWHDEYLTQLVQLWGKGKSSFEIAVELGIDRSTVKYRLMKHGLYKTRVNQKEGA